MGERLRDLYRMLMSSMPPVLVEVYPNLVRARIAAGWDATAAATTPPARRAHVTAAQAEEIRTAEATARELSKLFGISIRQVRRIRRGWAWKKAISV